MTNNKYSGRSMTSIHRDNGSVDSGDKEPSWFSEYINNFEKSSAKSKSKDYSLFDQINNILGNKSKYSSVEEAVNDMARRTGLDLMKKANLDIFNEIPTLKNFIDNYVQDRPGTSVEAVIHNLLKVKSIKEHLPETDDVPEDVKRYINDKIGEAIAMQPDKMHEDFQLGKLDLSDNNEGDDPFKICMPAQNKV